MKKKYNRDRGVGYPIGLLTPDTMHGTASRKGLSKPRARKGRKK